MMGNNTTARVTRPPIGCMWEKLTGRGRMDRQNHRMGNALAIAVKTLIFERDSQIDRVNSVETSQIVEII